MIKTRRDSLQRVTVAWIFGAAWMYLVTGASFTRYAKLLGVSPFGFGILAMIPFLGALVQLPTSLWLERYGHRKSLFLWSACIHRAMWLVIAGLPWLVPQTWQWPALLTILLTSTVLANVSTPAWLAWMAELVPGRIRGRFFSRRIQIGQAVGLVLSLLSGMVLDWPQADQANLLRNSISVMLAIAACLGIIDILIFTAVPEPETRAHRPAIRIGELIRNPLANRYFRLFLGYSFTMTFATGFVGQFVWLYIFDVVAMTNTRANLLVVTIPLLGGMLTYPFWGRLVDRFGSKPTLIIAGALIVNGASSWIFITRDSWVPGYLLTLAATLAWPGMEIAAFNLLLRMTETGVRNRTSDSMVIAVNSMVVAIAGTLSGLFGGWVAQRLGNEWQVEAFGRTWTYHAVLFIVSALLRIVAIGWIFALEEQHRTISTRDVLRYMATNVYSNLLQATFFPARVFTNLVGATWKLPRRRGSRG